jgi:hypothetical protein
LRHVGKFLNHFLWIALVLARWYHALPVLVGSAHAASDPAELHSDLYLLCPSVPRVDDCPLVVWERVPLGVFKLGEAGVEDGGKEHVQDVVFIDGLL